MFKNASYLMRFVFREFLARWRRISRCGLHVTYIVDDYMRRFICCMCRRRCGCIIRWVCTYLCVSFCFLLFVFHYGCSSQYKLALLSEAATVLARSSSVDVLYVRLRVYALSAVVVPQRVRPDRTLGTADGNRAPRGRTALVCRANRTRTAAYF